MFRWFESLIDPFRAHPQVAPPRRLAAFYWHHFRQVWPVFAALLASPDLPKPETLKMRRCTSAGEALPAEIGKRWTAHFGVEILDGLGSTEMLHIFIGSPEEEVRPGSTGRAVPGYEATAWFGIGMPKGTPRDVIDFAVPLHRPADGIQRDPNAKAERW